MSSPPASAVEIEAALRGGDSGRALALSEAALASGAPHPLPLFVVAAACEQAGRFEAAAQLLRQAIVLSPRDPALPTALGRCLMAARRPEQALTVLDAALAISPDALALLEGKARALAACGELDGARTLFERAIALNAAAFDARSALAAMDLQAGDAEAARQGADKVLAARPDQAEALRIRAAADLQLGDPAAAEAGLTLLRARSDQPPLARSEALLLLGEALHAQGRWAEAFDATVEGKAILRELYAERAAGRPGETEKARNLTAWLRACPPDAWGTPAAPEPVEGEADTHVFLVGFPRSGTTLLEQVLAGHPKVTALEERPTLAQPIDAFLTRPEGLVRLSRLGAVEAAEWRRLYWRGVRAFGVEPAGRVFIDKAPGETANLLVMARLFPRAKFLFAVRDPRDVVLSCLRQSFQMNAMTYEFTRLETAARCYDAVMGLADLSRARLALDLMEVRHEALVADITRGSRQVSAFLGLDWTPAMVDVAATAKARTIRTPSAPQVRRGLNARGLGAWRAYRAQLAPVLPVLAPWVERFGYSLDQAGDV